MNNTRRSFLKLTSVLGLGLTAESSMPAYGSTILPAGPGKRKQVFNMSGYAAPALNSVRIGVIGLGNRGELAVPRLSYIEGVDIRGLCDLRPERVAAMQKFLQGTSHQPQSYTGKEESWKKLCERDDIDLIYICTHWDLHTPIAVYAMQHGKHVCVEVPAAKTIEECWQLVDTSEKTKKHCMMLENCNYDYFELLTLNMARNGIFGEVFHAEGAYIHDILQGNLSKSKYWNMWRLKENMKRNGNLYPTHGLGPVCQVMNVNRGDKLDYMSSFSTNDFSMAAAAKRLAVKDESYQKVAGESFRGNMNTSVIRTQKGKTIMLQHDVSSPRPGSRIYLLSGTKGAAMKYPQPYKIALAHEWNDPENWSAEKHGGWLLPEQYKNLEEQYIPALYKKMGKTASAVAAKTTGGHSEMDFLMDWRMIDCLRNGLPLDTDVYDAALWSAIGPLSEWSVAHRSNSIDVPDFTRGLWHHNVPADISLEKGANTRVKI